MFYGRQGEVTSVHNHSLPVGHNAPEHACILMTDSKVTLNVCLQVVWKIAVICVSNQNTAGSIESPRRLSPALGMSVVCLLGLIPFLLISGCSDHSSLKWGNILLTVLKTWIIQEEKTDKVQEKNNT